MGCPSAIWHHYSVSRPITVLAYEVVVLMSLYDVICEGHGNLGFFALVNSESLTKTLFLGRYNACKKNKLVTSLFF